MSAAPSPEAEKPLAGIRVADFTAMLAGPHCTRLLADCGAEVIKVEAPKGGDHIRHTAPLRDGDSAYFGHLNCGKRSLAVDLKDPRGLAVARDLVATCDVLVENTRPGVMKRLGLDHASLAPAMPGLVYCSISGFGQSGPRAEEPAYAMAIHALSGFDMTNLHYQDDQDRPANSGTFVADFLAGAYAFGAIQTALLARTRTGRGQNVDLALMDAMLGMLAYECQEAQFPQAVKRPVYGPLRTSDGFVIVAIVSQKNFEQLADALDHPEWKSDPRFRDVAGRRNNWHAFMAGVEDWTRAHAAADCEARLMAAGIPCARYQSVAEAMRDPQVTARGLFVEARDAGGRFLAPQPPFRFADGSVGLSPQVPALGADGGHVLRKILGYAEDKIAALREAGIVTGF